MTLGLEPLLAEILEGEIHLVLHYGAQHPIPIGALPLTHLSFMSARPSHLNLKFAA